MQPSGSSSGLCFAASLDKGMQLSLSLWSSGFGKTQQEQCPENPSATNYGAHIFSLSVYDFNRTGNVPNSFFYLFIFLTDFLEGALLERKGDLLKLQSNASFDPHSVTTGVGFLVGPQKNNIVPKSFLSRQERGAGAKYHRKPCTTMPCKERHLDEVFKCREEVMCV